MAFPLFGQSAPARAVVLGAVRHLGSFVALSIRTRFSYFREREQCTTQPAAP